MIDALDLFSCGCVDQNCSHAMPQLSAHMMGQRNEAKNGTGGQDQFQAFPDADELVKNCPISTGIKQQSITRSLIYSKSC